MVAINGDSMHGSPATNPNTCNSRARRMAAYFKGPISLAIVMASFLHMMTPLLWSGSSSSSDTTSPRLAGGGANNNNRHERYWCMLTKPYKVNKWFGTTEHFPHTLEWYTECWTWLQEQSNFAGENVKGGYIIDDTVKRKLNRKYWNRAFFPAMKFPVQIWNNETEIEEVLDPQLVNDNYHKRGPYYKGGWFQRSDTCGSFRRRLWTNLGVSPPRKVNKKKKRIGIINRNESRAILNVNTLVRELERHYKHSKVEVATFDSEYELTKKSDTLANQAAWFADKDLIIMAHGAAMSNVIFMRPGTAILELFPRYYFNDMFWELMAQCQIYHSWYYDGNMTKKKSERYTQDKAALETEKEWKNRMQHKKNNIDFKWSDVDHIIKLLFQAIDSESHGTHNGK